MLGGSGGVHGSFARYVQPVYLLVVWCGGEALRLAPPGRAPWWRRSRTGNERNEDDCEWHGLLARCWGQGGCEVCADETAILEVERQVELLEKGVRDVDTFETAILELETRVEKMEQLEVQFVQLWVLAKLTELVVAELRTKFESRVKNLEQWGDTVAESLNAVQDRFEILERRW